MTIERKFVNEGISRAQIDEFVANELRRVGYAGMVDKKAPLGTRITIYAEKPGMVIGKKGKSIKFLTKTIGEEYKVENPQIEVDTVPIPELNPNIMATRLVKMLESGMHFRRSAYTTLRRVMAAGARGVEILLNGKLTGERARHERFKEGYIKKCGEPATELVYHANAEANVKKGTIGVQMRIMPPHLRLPDKINTVLDMSAIEDQKEESKIELKTEEKQKEPKKKEKRQPKKEQKKDSKEKEIDESKKKGTKRSKKEQKDESKEEDKSVASKKPKTAKKPTTKSKKEKQG